jgi:hypothetical protein
MEEELIQWVEEYIETHRILPSHFVAKEKAMELSKSGVSFKASKGWYEKFLNRHFSAFKNQINKSRNEEGHLYCDSKEDQQSSDSKAEQEPAKESNKSLSVIRRSFFPDPSVYNLPKKSGQIENSPGFHRRLPSEASDSVIEPDLYQQSVRKAAWRNNFTEIKPYKRV